MSKFYSKRGVPKTTTFIFLFTSIALTASLAFMLLAAPVYSPLEYDQAPSNLDLDLLAELEQDMALAESKNMSSPAAYSSMKEWRNRYLWPRVHALSKQAGLDPALVMAVVHVESSGNPKAVGPKGSQGLMQIHPNTAIHLGLEDPFNPDSNLQAGITYLVELKKAFDDDLHLTLAAYNAGPRKVKEAGWAVPGAQVQSYIDKVLDRTQYYKNNMPKVQ